jgi:hypothetical protein
VKKKQAPQTGQGESQPAASKLACGKVLTGKMPVPHPFGSLAHVLGIAKKSPRPSGKRTLAPKAVDTLLVLVENAGQLVEKTELMQRVWPDAFVEEGNLSKNIYTLRRSLSTTYDPRSMIYIKVSHSSQPSHSFMLAYICMLILSLELPSRTAMRLAQGRAGGKNTKKGQETLAVLQ